MASIEALPLAALGESDVAGCVALSAEAGWNQTERDWALFMRHGSVFGLADERGRPVATGAILPYPDKFAWISMVLVAASRRRQRIGTRILETCCAALTQRGLVAVLDATPAGERIYRPLGFEPMFRLTRWQGDGAGRPESIAGIRPMRPSDIAAVTALDATAFGSRRAFLVESLFDRAPQLSFVTADGAGFAMARPGRIATQIGPIVAANEATAAALLAAAFGASTGPVFLDLADQWTRLARELQARKFSAQRPFLRMGLGCVAPFGDVGRQFVVAGPEFG
jgi:ribosomal protein S18 acetylase RimI-like enzyme